jgi:O-antigen biosynthesis protein
MVLRIGSWLAGRRIPRPEDWAAIAMLQWREMIARARGGPASGRMDRTMMSASYRRWMRGRSSAAHRARARELARALAADNYVVHLLAFVRDAATASDLLASLRAQSYDRWVLYLALESAAISESVEGALAAAGGDVRVRLIDDVTRPVRDVVTGEHFMVLHTGEGHLVRDAMLHIAAVIRQDPSIDWIYTDEDVATGDGALEPCLKGAFNPELALTDDYATRLACVRVDAVGPLIVSDLATPAALYRLFLRLSERPFRVKHLAEVCLRRTPGTCHAVPDDNARQAVVAETLARRNLDATARRSPEGMMHIRWEYRRRRPPAVTVIIPTRDRIDLLQSCVSGLVQTVKAVSINVLIADDESQRSETLEYFDRLPAECPFPCRVIRVQRSEPTFNYAALINRAAAEVETPLMLHLNNDVEAIAEGWLEQMIGWFSIAEVGVVGAKLLYPDDTIQHSGVLLRAREGLPLHLFHGLNAEERGYLDRPHQAQNVSAVTGACLLTDTALFGQLGGFDAATFRLQYNDIDYCVRAAALGRRIVYEPAAVLRHRTSASRGGSYSLAENRAFAQKYGRAADEYWNPHLDPRSLASPTPLLVRT